MSEQKPLHRYTASAGSGKTYTLAREYIRLLLQNANTLNYRHILAVTFTNKATAEMKGRIIEELYKLSSGRESDFVASLARDIPEAHIRSRATAVLNAILHDYSHFSVSTIDRFFQQVIRAFVYETGLPGNYEIELDSNQAMMEAVDKLIGDLRKDDKMLNWLIQFSNDKTENAKSWNIAQDILAFAQKSIDESDLLEKPVGMEQVETLKRICKRRQDTFENELKRLAGEARKIIAGSGLQYSDFKGGNGTQNYIRQLEKFGQKGVFPTEKFFEKLPGQLENWTSKTKAAEIESLYYNGLNEIICKICEYFTKNIQSYVTANAILKNANTFAILSNVAENCHELLLERNTMLLSETNNFLNKIIKDGTDTPFVYEKVGTRIDHFMIDEFQDTSRLQWENFRPLIVNSLDAGNLNMLVGDAKQSIYRWRGSCWKTLGNPFAGDAAHTPMVADTALDTNYRSRENIVRFNNSFFAQARQILSDETDAPDAPTDIKDAYREIRQKVKPGFSEKNAPKGLVKVHFFENGNDEKWENRALAQLPEEIEKLIERGYSLKDIGILVRSNRDGKMIADFLLDHKKANPEKTAKYGYDVISNEALTIAGSPRVRLIVSMLRAVANPQKLTTNIAAYTLLTLGDKRRSPNDALAEMQNDGNLLQNELQDIRHKPVFELSEEIIARLGLGDDAGECAYIQAFQDVVFDFSSRHGGDVNRFLEWWDEFGAKKSLTTSQNQNAMQIVTIHKSKGLAFPVVLMPLCQWDLTKSGDAIWTRVCEEENQEKIEIGKYPIPFGSELKNSAFSREYDEEFRQQLLDNLNLLYVAFTRAKDAMIIFSERKNAKKTGEKTDSVGRILLRCLAESGNFAAGHADCAGDENLTAHFDDENDLFALGDVPPKTGDTASGRTLKMQHYRPNTDNSNIKLKLHSADFFGETENKINFGNLMHSILQRIYTESDVERILAQMNTDGQISRDETDTMRRMLGRLFEIDGVREWFSPKWKVLNETDIIAGGKQIFRPDRILIDGREAVVIDYKFGERERQAYVEQVRNYMNLVEEMGYRAKGYICYCKLGKVTEVA